MVRAVREHEARTLRRVVFALFGDGSRRAFEQGLER
jgi:hypothetical protein